MILKKETIFSERVNGEFKLRRDFFIKKNTKVVNLKIKKVKTWFCDKDLSSLNSIN